MTHILNEKPLGSRPPKTTQKSNFPKYRHMTLLSNENAKLYKVYPVSRLYIMTVGHMTAKWGSKPPQSNPNIQFLPIISTAK